MARARIRVGTGGLADQRLYLTMSWDQMVAGTRQRWTFSVLSTAPHTSGATELLSPWFNVHNVDNFTDYTNLSRDIYINIAAASGGEHVVSQVNIQLLDWGQQNRVVYTTTQDVEFDRFFGLQDGYVMYCRRRTYVSP